MFKYRGREGRRGKEGEREGEGSGRGRGGEREKHGAERKMKVSIGKADRYPIFYNKPIGFAEATGRQSSSDTT